MGILNNIHSNVKQITLRQTIISLFYNKMGEIGRPTNKQVTTQGKKKQKKKLIKQRKMKS